MGGMLVPSRGVPPTVALRDLPIFAGCADALLAEVAPYVATRVFRDGGVLCREGEDAEELFVILKGQATVTFDGVFLVPRGPDEVIGEQAFLNGTKRGATVTAQGMVQALVVRRPGVERLLADTAFTRNLLRAVSDKLSQATQDRAFRYRYEHLLFGAFRSHVSHEVLQDLLQSGENYGAPRTVRDAVILFADVRGFTARSVQMTPAAVAEELAAFLDHAVATIHEHGGVVDKFVGDAVMAVWGGFPARGEDIIARAFECARRLVESSRRLNFGGVPVEVGVGVNAGEVFMGNVGGEDKRQFTVLGSAVNLAARYQGLSAELGADVVVGPDMYERLPDDLRKTLGARAGVPVKGAGEQTLYTWSAVGTGGAGAQTTEGRGGG